MSESQHRYVADHYEPRAATYVTSVVHATGADLDQIEGVLRDRRDARVLDLGCGGGHVAYRAAPLVREVVACDITPGMLAEVARNATLRGLNNLAVRQAPAEELPFEDASFEVVLCRFTAHHWHDVEAGLREARRVLKREGVAVFVDVVAPAHPLLDTHLQALELLRDASHVRDYTVAEWAGMLGRAGFFTTGVAMRKLRMEFDVWTARTRTSEVYIGALRSLQAQASEGVKAHFAVGEDGSFDIDVVTFELAPALL